MDLETEILAHLDRRVGANAYAIRGMIQQTRRKNGIMPIRSLLRLDAPSYWGVRRLLRRLEGEGKVRSQWREGPYPRYRDYFLIR
jgi:hypothetical protein